VPAVTRVAIVGVTGYAGLESLRLLLSHPGVTVSCLASHSQAGADPGDVHPQLAGLGLPALVAPDADVLAAAADVAFLSLPARQALDLAPALLARGMRVVDFGADFRLRDPEAYARHYGGPHTAPAALAEAAYGLPEWHRAEIRGARLVANPGCYPTAAVLALGPALAAGAVEPGDIVVDAKSGASGAGRQPTPEGHLPEAAENVWPYRIAGEHRHTPEMEQELGVAAGRPVALTFSPHHVPMSRGLLATCYARLARPLSGAEAEALYREAYRDEALVRVLSALPATKPLRGSGAAHVAVRVDARVGRLVAVAAIDNLGRGAAAQAVQNLNLMLGLPETTGVPRVGLMP
jgi:N-acetyl-gamma-glutamyl-phosphate reductase